MDKRRSPKADKADTEDFAETIRHVSTRVRELRKAAHLTQTQLGDLIGAPQSQIYDLELGSQNITLRTLCRLATALKVEPRDLLPEGASSAPSDTTLVALSSLLDRVTSALDARNENDAFLLSELQGFAGLRKYLDALKPPP